MTLTNLDLLQNNMGTKGARSLAAALDTNRTLQHLILDCNNIAVDTKKEPRGRPAFARGKRRWQRRDRFSEEIAGGRRLKQRWGGAKMDAEAVVYEELKRAGRNSEKLANALSLLTSLE